MSAPNRGGARRFAGALLERIKEGPPPWRRPLRPDPAAQPSLPTTKTPTPTPPTWSPEAANRLRQYLATTELPVGLGTRNAACSIAAINLALTGDLTDEIPACMSKVVGHWVLTLQDGLPDNIRNGNDWKRLLPFAAGTGRAREQERLALILEWLSTTVLPHLQPLADRSGYGGQWRAMCDHHTETTASQAYSAIPAGLQAERKAAMVAVAAAASATHSAIRAPESVAVWLTARAAARVAKAVAWAAGESAAGEEWELADRAWAAVADRFKGEAETNDLLRIDRKGFANHVGAGLNDLDWTPDGDHVVTPFTVDAADRLAALDLPFRISSPEQARQAAVADAWRNFDPPLLLAALISPVPPVPRTPAGRV